MYDRDKKTLLFYHPHTGRFLRSEPFVKPTPGALAAWQGTYFYDNKSHDNYPDDTSLHYSLLASKDGSAVTRRYFPHVEAESAYRFTVTAHPLSATMILSCIIARTTITLSMPSRQTACGARMTSVCPIRCLLR